jgi:hypothetical protein
MPPLSITRRSRAVHSASLAADGATAETPMKGAPGIRTPGICSEVAQPVAQAPVHQERLGHDVAQEAQARDDRAEGAALGHDIEELDLQHVAGLGAPDVDGAGQGMYGARIHVREIGHRRAGRDLTVERVAAFQHDLLARADLEHGLNIGMIAVVARARLRRERLASVDANGGHGRPPLADAARS